MAAARTDFWHTGHDVFDVAILGGGIQGACLYARLVAQGRRVLLIDQGDFGGGTSQASAMLIWGGLLYLKNREFAEVMRLSASRDRMLRDCRGLADPHSLAYVFGPAPSRQPWFIHLSLWAYWLLGSGRRRVPSRCRTFAEQAFLSPAAASERLRFEEGRLRLSDAQFVMNWIAPSAGGQAVNYCVLDDAQYDPHGRAWTLRLRDALSPRTADVSAACVVNATGVWADRVNARCGISAPWRQLLAKGVSLSVARPPDHHDTLVFDNPSADEGMSLVPWGPVSLWGSTETIVDRAEDGWRAEPREVDYLLGQLNKKLRRPVGRDAVISLRCGVRSLAVPTDSVGGDPLRFSKRWRLHCDAQRPWISIFGGKITACLDVAARVERVLGRILRRAPCRPAATAPVEAAFEQYPGLTQPVPAAGWCATHQMCRTLEDYLRRRTNIAQWVPRGGLGRSGEHRPALLRIAAALCNADPAAAQAMVAAYEGRIVREHDAVLGF
ncbi:MAG TPA: FAD-dependent oxidoreductase [Tepidisphaeraceae bacterium]|jgi:glycerol-3-phosphate dehydrogenase